MRAALERFGRRLLLRLVAWLFGAKPRAVQLSAAPSILVIRTDARLGNIVMLTPLLRALRVRYAEARLTVLAHRSAAPLLEGLASVTTLWPYDKRDLLGRHGPLRTIAAMRRAHFEVVIDATNPTDPSFTQAALTRFSGAPLTLGPAHGAFARLYTQPVRVTADRDAGPAPRHEIALRLALLGPLGLSTDDRTARLPEVGPRATTPSDVVRTFVEGLPNPRAVVNLGARLADKRLPAADYARVAAALAGRGFAVVLTYGPSETPLAEAVRAECPTARLAPPTTIGDLGFIFSRASLVVSCDTGPMHLAVAVGTPTCALFVSTDPARYGYDSPHLTLAWHEPTSRQDLGAFLRWLDTLPPAAARF